MSPEILHEAAEWLVRLDDQPSGRDREAFRAWLAQDTEHLEAFQRMQETLAPLQVLKQAPARSALLTFKQQRSAQVLKAFALVAVLAVPLGLYVHHQGGAYLLADIRTGSGEEQAWARHQLVVRERPLVEVLEQLDRNHSGYLLFDRKALANIRVTAVLPADDSARALRLLARSLPLRIDHYTPWVTWVRYLPESEFR